MSMEIQTTYAPLNTTIDGDRDYRELTGLEACGCSRGMSGLEACGCGPRRRLIPPGVHGFYEDDTLPQGMLGEAGGGNAMLYVLGGLAAAWALWAWYTPHEEYGR